MCWIWATWCRLLLRRGCEQIARKWLRTESEGYLKAGNLTDAVRLLVSPCWEEGWYSVDCQLGSVFREGDLVLGVASVRPSDVVVGFVC